MAQTSDEQQSWTDELPVSGRAETNLRAEYDSFDDLLNGFRNADDISDIDYIGSKTMGDLRKYITDHDPDAERARKENDTSICTEFTEDVETDGDATFAFVCPKCGEKNPLKGEPTGFKNKPFACIKCNWVSLLDADALKTFDDEKED